MLLLLDRFVWRRNQRLGVAAKFGELSFSRHGGDWVLFAEAVEALKQSAEG
jgi:hypothetical protein